MIHKPQHLFIAAGLTASALLFTNCVDEDYGYEADYIKYQKNFTEMYGQIPSDKSWDLSSAAGAFNPSVTRALGSGADNEDLVEGTHYQKKDYWQVPEKTLQWLEQNLTEGKDNRWLGSHFVLKIDPNSDFAIVPIYQGRSAINSSLSIKINGYNLKEICPRSKDIQAKRTASSDWEDLGYYDGWASTSFADFQAYKNGTNVLHPSYTDEDYAVQAKPVYFRTSKLTNLQNDGFMYLDLINDDKMLTDVNDESKKWDSGNTWTKIGDHLTSINPKGQMVALNLPWDGRPENNKLPDIHEGTGANHKMPSQVLIIGCEDAHGTGSDYDVNDVVYMIIGYPNAPEIVPATQIIKKRYMCEDLGATDDFDFNDIVIDVTQSMEYELTTNPDDKAEEYDYDGNIQVYMQPKLDTKKQWARVSHVCGTLPFQVKVGDYFFPKVTDPTDDYKTRTQLAGPAKTTRAIDIAATDGWNPNETKDITGWDPDANNIAICVEWNRGRKADNTEHFSVNYDKDSKYDRFADFANGNCKIVEFPQNGDVPYIIATDQDVPWMKERVSIPETWVTGDLSSREGAAGPGSSAQYLDYGNDADGHTNEAIIWTGDVFGQPYKTGLNLGNDASSSTYEGLKESFAKSFNILAVYTDKPGSFGLCCDDNGWNLLHTNDADQYVVSTEMVNGLYCTKIMLTGDQINRIREKGLIVQDCTEGMHIRQVSMMRNNPDRGGFGVRFNIPEGGKVTTPAYRRYRDDNKDNVPFEDATFANGSSVEFTATPEEGYEFDYWEFRGNDVTTTSSHDNPLTVSNTKIAEWGITNNIIRIVPHFKAKTLCKVGAHIVVNGSESNVLGKIQISSESTLRNAEGEALSTPHEVTLSNGEFVYVYEGSTVTFKAPINHDYKVVANYFDLETMTRTSEVNYQKDGFTPYINYTEKADPDFKLTDESQSVIVLDYATPSVNIGWSHLGDGAVTKSGYDYATEVNLWDNSVSDDKTSGVIHMRAQEKNFANKKIYLNLAATNEYKSAKIELDVTVQDYIGTGNWANTYRVPIADNAIRVDKIKDALHISASNTKNIKIQVHREGTGLDDNASIYSSTNKTDWTKVIRTNKVWTSFARGNESYSDVSYGMPPRSICFIISADDFKNYFSEWNASIVIDTSYKGWDQVYVSLTDDAPF